MKLFGFHFLVRLDLTVSYRFSRQILFDEYLRLWFSFPVFEAIDDCNHNHIEWLAERWNFVDRLPSDWRTPNSFEENPWFPGDYYLNEFDEGHDPYWDEDEDDSYYWDEDEDDSY